MARTLTSPEKALLRLAGFKVRFLVTFHLDSGTYRFCDDIEDVSDGSNTYIGAAALANVSDIKGSQGLAAEGVTLVVDGARVSQSGFTDPAQLFRDILGYKLHQRRVDISLGFSELDSATLTLVIPVYAGKINNAKITDPKLSFDGNAPTESIGNMEIALDSLAHRYGRVTGRTRSHNDQLEIDSSDMFFSFVQDMAQSKDLYWGKIDAAGKNGFVGYGNGSYNNG